MGWRGGCLAAGLVRSAVRHFCLGGCSALLVCARRSRQIGRAGPVPLLVAPPPPPSLSLPRVPRGACSGLPRPGVPCPRLLVRHSMWSVRSASSVRLPFRCAPRVRCVFVCSRTRGGRVSPPFHCRLARALREVPSQVASKAVPGSSCPSAFPARIPCSACRWWGGFGLVWVNASPGRPGPQSAQPSLRDSTGLGAPGCRGLKACRTADSPRTPRWHTREGDTAVPVCVVCAPLGCLWV